MVIATYFTDTPQNALIPFYILLMTISLKKKKQLISGTFLLVTCNLFHSNYFLKNRNKIKMFNNKLNKLKIYLTINYKTKDMQLSQVIIQLNNGNNSNSTGTYKKHT